MTATYTATPTAKTPWHLWAVGGFGLLWNAYGGYDYTMSKLRGAPYYQELGMTPAQIAQMDAMPAWMTAVWAVGVWGALLGALLLLLRLRLAVPVFAASLIAYVASLVYAYAIAPSPEASTQAMMIMQGVILAGCVFFLWYALGQARNGVLR
jgi:hypothetical protein